MRVLNMGTALGCALLFSMGGAEVSNAATVNIDSSSNGWYRGDGLTTTPANSVIVGWNNITGQVYNNWTTYNLSSLAGQNITSATLTFRTNIGSYSGTDASETLGLFGFGGNINSLTNNQFSTANFTDLGDGPSYGQTVVNKPTGQLGTITITLSAQAIADMMAAANNATDQRFVIGGSLLTVALAHDGSNWYTDGALFFGGNTTNPAFLSIETSPVPLPAALPMFASALAGGGLMAWRRKRKAAKEAKLAAVA